MSSHAGLINSKTKRVIGFRFITLKGRNITFSEPNFRSRGKLAKYLKENNSIQTKILFKAIFIDIETL